MSEGLEALFNEEKSEPVVTPVVTEPSGPARDESGRFAATQPVATPAPVAATPAPIAPVAPVTPEPAKEPGHIPISALLDEREKRQALQKQLNELQARQQTPEAAPTFQTAEEIQAYVQREAANAAWSAKVDGSEYNARDKHGDATVETAMQWNMAKCEAEKAALGFSPFAVEQMRQRHPIDWVVRQHKRDALLSEIGDDPEAYKAKIKAELAAVALDPTQPLAAVPQPAPVQPKPATPSASLASAPSAGGPATIPTGHGVAFEGAFRK